MAKVFVAMKSFRKYMQTVNFTTIRTGSQKEYEDI
jgi:hypothetical protein